MQHNATEDHQNEEDPEEGPRRVMALHSTGHHDESHQQQESRVHVDVDSRQPADLP